MAKIRIFKIMEVEKDSIEVQEDGGVKVFFYSRKFIPKWMKDAKKLYEKYGQTPMLKWSK